MARDVAHIDPEIEVTHNWRIPDPRAGHLAECVSCSADRAAGEFPAERVSELSPRISGVSSREWVHRRDRTTTPSGVRDRYSGVLFSIRIPGGDNTTGCSGLPVRLWPEEMTPYPQDARQAELSDSTNATVKPPAVARLREFLPDCDHTAMWGYPPRKVRHDGRRMPNGSRLPQARRRRKTAQTTLARDCGTRARVHRFTILTLEDPPTGGPRPLPPGSLWLVSSRCVCLP